MKAVRIKLGQTPTAGGTMLWSKLKVMNLESAAKQLDKCLCGKLSTSLGGLLRAAMRLCSTREDRGSRKQLAHPSKCTQRRCPQRRRRRRPRNMCQLLEKQFPPHWTPGTPTGII